MASRSFRQFVEQELGKFPNFVIYAILEWVLIILLFLDGFLSFLSHEFAKFFELHTPCLLCTKIDHIFIHRNPNFYYNEPICEDHKRDISSLAYCHVHRKLSDIQNLCEGCLLSFATERESDCDTYKSTVESLYKNGDMVQVENNCVDRCSCCGEPLKMRPFSKVMTRNSSINGSVFSQAPAPSPRAPLVTRIGYTELKIMTGNETEFLGDEDGSNVDNQSQKPLIPETEDMNEELCRTPSFSRGNKFFGIPLTDSAPASPRFSTRLPRKFQFEKSELFFDPTHTISKEADADSVLNRLKRQVRLDRKALIALYMELDEERSASAIAANNAMAMITRLQAEKAAVQMEALQYQRMMEEQAEYDQEALQVMKDLVGKREEEFKDLESELEAYREKYGKREEYEVDADEDYQEYRSQSLSSMSECDSPGGEAWNGDNEGSSERYGLFGEEQNVGVTLDESSLGFECERSYLLGLLTSLEREINLSPDELDDGIHCSQSNIDMVKHEDEDRGHGNKASLTREMSQIRERLRAVEADSGFLKRTAVALQKGCEGTKLLTEIAHHLRKLRHSEKKPMEEIDA